MTMNNFNNNNNNSGIEFLDFVTIANYLMGADAAEDNAKFRLEMFKYLQNINTKLDTILTKLNKEND